MQQLHLSDTEILEKIHADELGAVEQLYDKYAPHVFGIINQLSKDAQLNEFMLLRLFTNLTDDIKPALHCRHLASWLFGHTFKFTLTELFARGIQPDIEAVKNSPLPIQRLYKTFITNQQASGQIIEVATEQVASTMLQ